MVLWIRPVSLLAWLAFSAPGAVYSQSSDDDLLDLLIATYEHIGSGEIEAATERYEISRDRIRNHPDRSVDVLATASTIASQLGRYNDSVEFASRGLEIARKAHDTVGQAACHNNLGLGLRYLGRNMEALQQYTAALKLNESLADELSCVQTQLNIGLIHFFMGRFSQALSVLTEALRRAERNSDQDWSKGQQRIAKINLGSVLERIGATHKALELYRDLLDEPDLPLSQKAHLHSNLGRVYRELEDPHRALSHFETAAELFTRVGEPGSLGNLYLAHGRTLCDNLKQHEEAQVLFQKALSISREISDRNEEVFDLYYSARCHGHTGELDRALALSDQAVAAATETGYREGLWLALAVRAELWEKKGHKKRALDNYLESLEHLEDVRAHEVDEIHRAGFLVDKQQIYSSAVRLLLDSATGSAVESSQKTVAKALHVAERARARSLLDQLGAHPLTASDIQGSLEPDEMIVDIILAEDRPIVFLVSPERIKAFDLPRIKNLQGLVSDCRTRIAQSNGREPTMQSRGDSTSLRELSDQLWAPVLARIPPTVRRLNVIPDLTLAFVPFAALYRTSPSGREERIVERFSISYCPSSSALIALRGKPVGREALLELAAFADPDLPSRPLDPLEKDPLLPSSEIAMRSLPPLPGTREEVLRISQHIPGPHELSVGELASPARFFEAVRKSPRILHLATHTSIDSMFPENSAIVLTPEPGGESAVRLSELSGRNMETEIVSLSSCESALGKRIRGEGVQGFARAFLEAGARCVLCTLWPVSDERTPVFMDQFYYRLGRGDSVANALRSAQVVLLRDPNAGDPRYWSPYILVGDGSYTPYPRPSTSLRSILLGAALALGLALLALAIVLTKRGLRTAQA